MILKLNFHSYSHSYIEEESSVDLAKIIDGCILLLLFCNWPDNASRIKRKSEREIFLFSVEVNSNMLFFNSKKNPLLCHHPIEWIFCWRKKNFYIMNPNHINIHLWFLNEIKASFLIFFSLSLGGVSESVQTS